MRKGRRGEGGEGGRAQRPLVSVEHAGVIAASHLQVANGC